MGYKCAPAGKIRFFGGGQNLLEYDTLPRDAHLPHSVVQ